MEIYFAMLKQTHHRDIGSARQI